MNLLESIATLVIAFACFLFTVYAIARTAAQHELDNRERDKQHQRHN